MMTLFILTHSPYSGPEAFEAVEAILVSGAFDQKPVLLFKDDAVLQLIDHQQSKLDGVRSLSNALASLEHYDVSELYVCEQSLGKHNLASSDLYISTTAISAAEIHNLIAKQTTVVTF